MDAHKQQDVVERLVYNSRNVLSLSAVDRNFFVFPKAIYYVYDNKGFKTNTKIVLY